MRQRGQRRQRLDPADRLEPAAHVRPVAGASARAPPDVEVPRGQRVYRHVQPASRAGNRRARHPVRACASAARTWSLSRTPCAWASGGLCHRCVPTRRTSADQPRSARSPPAPALVASSWRLDPGAEQPAERCRDPRTTGRRSSRRSRAARRRWWPRPMSPRGSRSTAAPGASCRPRPRRRTRRARSWPGVVRRRPRGERQILAEVERRGELRDGCLTVADGGDCGLVDRQQPGQASARRPVGVCTGPASCAIEAWPNTSRSAAAPMIIEPAGVPGRRQRVPAALDPAPAPHG